MQTQSQKQVGVSRMQEFLSSVGFLMACEVLRWFFYIWGQCKNYCIALGATQFSKSFYTDPQIVIVGGLYVGQEWYLPETSLLCCNAADLPL